MDSKGHAGADLEVSDTMGDTVKIGVCPYLSGFIDSVVVTIFKYRNNTDSVFVLKNFSSDVDTQWSTFTFATVGKWNVFAKAIVQGGRLYTLPGEIRIFGKNVSASIQPATETRVVDSVAAFTVSSNADTPFTCQWYHGTAAVAGETGVSLVKSHLAFSDSGKYTCTVVDKWGDTGIASTAAILTVVPRVRTNTKPTISFNGHSTILSTEICSLTVSAIDPDSGQTHEFAVKRAPAGYSFAGHLFTWAPPAGYLGQDTIKTDTAIFTVTDNGLPPLSDTQKMAIVVSLKILPPDSVKGLMAVSRINGSFVLKWNTSKNADQYTIYRSRDTTGFVLYTTTPDTMFTNAIGDTSFYYYVVATNSKGTSPASLRVHSTTINTAPKWSHETINISINEGSSFSFNCADSCKDTNGDAISFSLLPGLPATDSLIGTTWKYSPSYADSNQYTVKIKAWDGMDSSILTMVLHVVNVPRPPQPQAQNLSTNRSTALQITLAATDPDGDAITSWTIDTQTTHGTTSIASSAQPNVTYTPTAGFIGTDYFTFKASVGSLTSTYSARVTIKVDTNNIAPTISTKLAAKTLNKGDSLILTITINSDAFPAPWYYWYKAGTLLDSTQVNSWKKLNAQGSDSGSYYVIVSNSAGRDSSGAHITVNVPATITTQPSTPSAKCPGDSVTLRIAAAGTTPLSYQWQLGGTNISGDTFPTCHLASIATANAGIYACKVNNICNIPVMSKPCTLLVNTPSVAPTSVTAASPNICPGNSTTLSVVGGSLGTGATAWKWFTGSCGGTVLGTGTSISTGALNATAKFYVSAQGTCNTTCDSVIVTVNSPPAITSGPVSQTKYAGGSAIFTVTATGSAPLTYLWKKGGTVFGGNFPACTLSNVVKADSGAAITCTISNSCNSAGVSSGAATLKVIPFVKVAAGGNSCLALAGDSTVWGFGDNGSGQLGDGSNAIRTSPVQVMRASNLPLTNIVDIAEGGSHSLFLLADGTVWACGANTYGQLGDGTKNNRSYAVNIPSLSNVRMIAAGNEHSIFLLGSYPYVCGHNDKGQLGLGLVADTSTPTFLSVGYADGVNSICAGSYHSMFCNYYYSYDLDRCGLNNLYQLGDGTTTNQTTPEILANANPQSIAAGYGHSIMIKKDGSLYTWGDNSYGQLCDGTTRQTTPYLITSITDPQSIAAGSYHSLVLTTTGVLWICGRNNYGQLGNNSTSDQSYPIQLSTNVVSMAGGISHTVFAKVDGSVWTCGYNFYGQLGIGTMVDSHIPVQVKF
jgi:alpha-tubulin suppressor-like RCC1 family protein